MKVTIGITGMPLTTPDYSMLRAALVAAQAVTPTARASGQKAKPVDPRAALHILFTNADPAAGAADALGNSFARERPDEEDSNEKTAP